MAQKHRFRKRPDHIGMPIFGLVGIRSLMVELRCSGSSVKGSEVALNSTRTAPDCCFVRPAEAKQPLLISTRRRLFPKNSTTIRLDLQSLAIRYYSFNSIETPVPTIPSIDAAPITMASNTTIADPGLPPDLFDQTTLVSLASTVLILAVAYGTSLKALSPSTPGSYRFLFVWHAFDALIHFFLEGSFLYNASHASPIGHPRHHLQS